MEYVKDYINNNINKYINNNYDDYCNLIHLIHLIHNNLNLYDKNYDMNSR